MGKKIKIISWSVGGFIGLIVVFISVMTWFYPYSIFSVDKSYAYQPEQYLYNGKEYAEIVSEFKDSYQKDLKADMGNKSTNLIINRTQYILPIFEQEWLAYWENLHLNKGVFEGKSILPQEIFELTTSVQSPDSLPLQLPKFGFLWWIKNGEVSVNYNELGSELPDGSYQILGASGCSCTVIREYYAVAVRMSNSLNAHKNLGFDYIKDIQMFGNLVISSLKNS